MMVPTPWTVTRNALIRGRGRLRRLAAWVKFHLSRRAVVLLYHRVAEPGTDPQLLAVSASNFASHLEVIREAYRPVSLRELRKAIQQRSVPHHAVVVTFDDGYADNLTAAKPLLERYQVPGTVFVTTGAVESAGAFWWDELASLLLGRTDLPPSLAVRIGGRLAEWKLTNPAPNAQNSETDGTYRSDSFDPEHNGGRGRPPSNPVAALRPPQMLEGERPREPRSKTAHESAAGTRWSVLSHCDPTLAHAAYRELCARVRPLNIEDRDAVLGSIRQQLDVERVPAGDARAMTRAELQDLARGGLVEIGAHTVNHVPLSAMVADRQVEEITESRQTLEGIIRSPVDSFSYPFGEGADYSGETVEMVKRSGLSCACANVEGVVTKATDPFQIPRFVVRDWDGPTFAAKLHNWFTRPRL